MLRFVPYAAAALLDAIDLVTFGPMGLWVGFVLGGVAGWFLAEHLGFVPRNRWMGAALGGLYCMLPGTSVLPLATVVTAIRQFSGASEPAAAQTMGERASERAVEESIVVDYRTVDEPDQEPKSR